jgi:hypothetical protein
MSTRQRSVMFLLVNLLIALNPVVDQCYAGRGGWGGGGGGCNSVPEPSSLLLLAVGGFVLYISRRSNKK